MNDENKTQGNSEWLETYGLALEDRVSCDSADCNDSGVLFSKVSCCGAVLIACDECMHKAAQLVMWMMHNGKAIVCEGCGAKCSPKGWMSKPEKL